MLFLSSEMTKDKFKGDSICHYEITKQELDSSDFTRIGEFMQQLESYGFFPRQKIWFTFAGFDSDKRELILVPEVVKYAQAFINKHPSFWYYAIPEHSPFFFMAMTIDMRNFLVVANDVTRQFKAKLDIEITKTLLEKMGVELEKYGDTINDKDGAMKCLMSWSRLISFG